MSKTLSNKEGELYSTTKVKNNELDGLRVKHRKDTSQSQTELSENSLCGAQGSDTQNQPPEPIPQGKNHQGKPEILGASRSEPLEGKPEVQEEGSLGGGKSAGKLLEYLKIALLVTLVIIGCLNLASSNKNNSQPLTGYSGGLLSSGDSPDAKKTLTASGNSSKGNKVNNKLLNRVNSLTKEVKNLKTQIQKLIKEVGAIKPPARGGAGIGGQGNQQSHKKIDALQKLINQLSKGFSKLSNNFDGLKTNLGTQVGDILQKIAKLTEAVTTRTQRIEQKIDSVDEKVGGLSSEDSTDLTPVVTSLDVVKTHLSTLLNKTPLFTYQDYLKFFHFNTQVEVVADHSASNIGGSYTRVVIKNKNSYLISSSLISGKLKGYILIEDGKKIEERHLSHGANDIMNGVYVKECNCYFLIISQRIYRKNIDTSPPVIWISGSFGWHQHVPFLYSEKQKRIVAVKSKKSLAIIDPINRKIEFELPISFANYIFSVKFFGENDQYLVFATLNRHVGIFHYDFEAKQGKVITSIYQGGPDSDQTLAVDINAKNRVILVCTNNQSGVKSRIMAFEF